MHHFSSLQSGSDNHQEWLDLNQPYHDRKWFENSDHAWETPFGHCEPDSDTDFNIPTIQDWKRMNINKTEAHSSKWLPLGYPPYPVEYEINRFWELLHKD